MHDTYLLNNISKMLQILCNTNQIKKVNYLKIVVNVNSHVNDINLREYLMTHHQKLITEDMKLDVIKDNIEEQTAIIETIQGE